MHDRRGRHRDQRTGGSSRTQDSTDEDHPVDEFRGKIEVFVRPFPEAGTSLRQVSVNGGTEPVWAHRARIVLPERGERTRRRPVERGFFVRLGSSRRPVFHG